MTILAFFRWRSNGVTVDIKAGAPLVILYPKDRSEPLKALNRCRLLVPRDRSEPITPRR